MKIKILVIAAAAVVICVVINRSLYLADKIKQENACSSIKQDLTDSKVTAEWLESKKDANTIKYISFSKTVGKETKTFQPPKLTNDQIDSVLSQSASYLKPHKGERYKNYAVTIDGSEASETEIRVTFYMNLEGKNIDTANFSKFESTSELSRFYLTFSESYAFTFDKLGDNYKLTKGQIYQPMVNNNAYECAISLVKNTQEFKDFAGENWNLEIGVIKAEADQSLLEKGERKLTVLVQTKASENANYQEIDSQQFVLNPWTGTVKAMNKVKNERFKEQNPFK